MEEFLRSFDAQIARRDTESILYKCIDGVEILGNFIQPDFWTIDVASVDDHRALQLGAIVDFCKRTPDCEVCVYESVLHNHPELLETICQMGFVCDGSEYWVWSRKQSKRKRARIE